MTNFNSLFCRNCHNWDVVIQEDNTVFMADANTRVGRCKAKFPSTYSFNGAETAFPLVREDDWCYPGRVEMWDNLNPAQATNETVSKQYDEL